MAVDYALIGRRLANVRRQKRLTQERLAEMTELANNYISNIENNRSIPSIETLMKLCGALEITPNDLLLGTSTTSVDYLEGELARKIADCTPRERNVISGMITLLRENRENG